jgi:hypothetical protein
LFDLIFTLLSRVHLESIIKGEGIDLFKDSLESDKRFLQDFVPMVLRQVNDHGNEHWERLFLVGLQDVQEVIVFEEAHGPVGDLQVDATNAFYNYLEKFWD